MALFPSAFTGRLLQSEWSLGRQRSWLQVTPRFMSAEAVKEESPDAGNEYHNIIKDTERAKGNWLPLCLLVSYKSRMWLKN